MRRERHGTASVSVNPLNCTLGRYPNGIFATCKRGGFVLQRAIKPAKEMIAQNPPQECLQTRATSGLVFAKQAAAADVAGGGSRWQQVAASRQPQKASMARYTARCATRCKNGEKCEMRVFRCNGTRSRTAGSRRTVKGESGLLELALLLSAQSPVSPATFLTSQKMARNAKCAFFIAMALGRAQQAARETFTSKSGLPELVPLLSTRSPVSPVASLHQWSSVEAVTLPFFFFNVNFFFIESRHTASAPSTAGTHTGGVQ